jgi:hypothetical protein
MKSRVPPAWHQEARKLRAKRFTCKEIALRCGVSHQRVYQILGPQTERKKRTFSTSGRPLKGGRTTEPGYLEAQARAQELCNRAIRRGELIRQTHCEKCGSTTRVDAHHEDYEKPLEVMWLCRRHHVRRHFEMARERWGQMHETEREAWQREHVRW